MIYAGLSTHGRQTSAVQPVTMDLEMVCSESDSSEKHSAHDSDQSCARGPALLQSLPSGSVYSPHLSVFLLQITFATVSQTCVFPSKLSSPPRLSYSNIQCGLNDSAQHQRCFRQALTTFYCYCRYLLSVRPTLVGAQYHGPENINEFDVCHRAKQRGT